MQNGAHYIGMMSKDRKDHAGLEHAEGAHRSCRRGTSDLKCPSCMICSARISVVSGDAVSGAPVMREIT
jgi:hypothetical protein